MRTTNYGAKIVRGIFGVILMVFSILLFALGSEDQSIPNGTIRIIILFVFVSGMIFGYILSLNIFKNKIVSSFGKDIRFSMHESSSFTCKLLIKTRGLKINQIFVIKNSANKLNENTGKVDLKEDLILSEESLNLIIGDDTPDKSTNTDSFIVPKRNRLKK